MTAYGTCDFEGCEEEATAELRFELTEPSASEQTMGTFRLRVCPEHTRQEFMPAELERTSLPR